MSKRKNKEPTSREIEAELIDRYKRWKDIYENGCSDPFWEDGVNLDLVRNHIIFEKRVCEEVLGDKYFLYPDAYFYPLPAKLPNDFMAVDKTFGTKGKSLKSTKTLPYEGVVRFDWSEVL